VRKNKRGASQIAYTSNGDARGVVTFVEEPQRWVEGSIEMLKEKRFGVDGVYRYMFSAMRYNLDVKGDLEVAPRHQPFDVN